MPDYPLAGNIQSRAAQFKKTARLNMVNQENTVMKPRSF
jgi:hypothetical protein